MGWQKVGGGKMLERLLTELKEGQTVTIAGLATRLETTPGLIQMMLEHLERQGQVETVELCQEGCSACPLSSLCSAEKRQQFWQLKSPC